ncbi:MAG: amino acid ABC transporter ATP-binding protein, partial [Anaerolineae bacterium]|nr:amino acid ABC transporter ATP-binding protein [Anaerolineae bacterium]
MDNSKNEAMVVIENVSKHFGHVRAVNNVSLKIKSGEVVVIIGPSGSGKSTLLRCINFLEIPTDGDIWVDGIHLSKKTKNINAVRREVGMVFQQFNLFPHLTALQNITIAQRVVRKRSKQEAIEVARQQLQRVGIPEKEGVYPGQLSGGQQQRVAIARALVTQPSLLLADEPTGALDSKTTAEILDLFDELHAQGLTLVVVTHEHSVAERAGRVITVSDGAIVGDALAARPTPAVTATNGFGSV